MRFDAINDRIPFLDYVLYPTEKVQCVSNCIEARVSWVPQAPFNDLVTIRAATNTLVVKTKTLTPAEIRTKVMGICFHRELHFYIAGWSN